MKKIIQLTVVTFVLCTVVFNFSSQAQSPNIAPLAVASASTCNTGACSTLNDLNFGTCGTQQMWISTGTPPSTTPGVEWIEWNWPTTQSFDKMVIHHAETASRFLAGFTMQTWNGTAWVTTGSVSGLPMQCSNTVTFSRISTARFRITSFLASGSQLSNMNFREIEIFNTKVFITDASVSAITSPVTPIGPGTANVTATIKNFGSSTLTSAELGWSVNNVLQTPPSNWAGSLVTGASSGTITMGSYNFPLGTHRIKVWTKNPNNLLDSFPTNDTAIYDIVVCNVFGGNIVVGPAPSDYTTISAALTAISSCGINAPVNITVKKGTYTGRIVITPIAGTSATNRITVDGVNPDSVKITYAGTPVSTIAFNGADYITFKNITIENTSTTAGCGTWFGNAADYNTLDNCRIICDATGTSSTVIPVMCSATEGSYSTYGNSANYLTINNCLIYGGYFGATIFGASTTSKCNYNTISNCKFDKQYYYGMYWYYQSNNSIVNNYIAGFRVTTPYGLYTYYNDYTKIIDNTIIAGYVGLYSYYPTAARIERNNISSGYLGLYVYYAQNSADSTMVLNNLVRCGGNISYPYGNALYVYYSYKVSVYHNTFQTDSTYTSPTSYGTAQLRYNYSGIKVKNNIFKSNGNMPVFNTDGQGIANGDVDYNIYYSVIPGNIIAYWGTTTYTSFNVWKSAMPNFNKNSLGVDPQLISKYNLHLKSGGATFYRGTPLGILKDVDNDDRCLPVPTIGGDEYQHPYDKPKADFAINNVACENSPYTFLNKAGLNEPKRHFWYVNDIFKSSEVNYTHYFDTSGIDTITLVTQNCSTTDTVSKVITVGLPTVPPVSYFVSDKNKLEVNEQLNLSDMSSQCPEEWQWTIVPDSVFDPAFNKNICSYNIISGNDTTQFFKIAFQYSGTYSICLTTKNIKGQGNSYCLNNYIEVLPAVKLCSSPFETKEYFGSLYDDGGTSGQYSNNQNCGFSIHPCAKTVSLVFSSFDVAQGDYIRIFDGRDNQGAPMWNPTLYPGGMNNMFVPPSPTDTFVAQSGAMYIEFISDGGGQGNGISAKWFSDADTYSPTDASFDITDTICNGVVTTFYNTSTGVQNDYFWDYDNNGSIDASTFDGSRKYSPDGYYTVKLTVKGCGGVDSMMRTIYVNTQLSTPEFELLTNNNTPNVVSEMVTINQNTLKNCIDTTVWDISPKSYTIISGNENYSPTLMMKFSDSVCYDFTVIGKYHGFSDTMYYPCFIKPVNYCKPFVTYMNTDIGISRVRLNTLDKSSPIGVSAYSDYTGTSRTELEKGASYNITLERYTSSNPMSRKVWIDYNRDGIFDNGKELVAQEASAFTLSWTEMFTLPKNLALGVTRMRVAASLGNYANTSCGPATYGEYEDYQLVIIEDKTKPVMSLIGPPEIHVLECSGGYFDPGVVVTDNADTALGNNVVVTGKVDPYIAGTYIITYDVEDKAGNAADQLTRTVIVDKEQTPPEISLTGNPVQIMQIFTSYIDSGYVAFDTCSGMDRVESTNNIDTANIGSYLYTYRAFDKNGNYADVSRTVIVEDTIDPVISSISNDTILLNIFNILPNPLYTITDNYYPYYQITVTIKGTYYETFPNGEATIPGFYNFMYVATDGSGNSDSINFVINVLDKVKPTLQLLGNISYTICRFDTLEDPGYTVKDNYDQNPQVVKSGTYITKYLKTRMLGNYELIYTATDVSGNKSVASRFVTVSDQGACKNSINGDAITNGIRVYPNPGSGRFNMEFKISAAKHVSITIYNTLGTTIYTTEEEVSPGQLKEFDYSDMKPGMYFIRLSDGEQITTIKYNLMR